MLFRQSFLLGRREHRAFLRYMKSRGTDLAALLGSPLYADENNRQHATWFDAAELSDLIADDCADPGNPAARGGGREP